ncbi:hypothetical protein [Clostridium kluyveri]|uniref:Uncharacterized protein n=1 Tax=Clostridium kluyveri TaxID=1534 RepID=A0A1L5F4K9_CLOKL|nr:hypothetical protein [Clostridium kluyveri]APM37958.1 hypothetical protein BS101_04015 [Clostridium kluyveri]UZQ52038.1 hypothetical protein OP486_07720 [Clostridium kluyveri]
MPEAILNNKSNKSAIICLILSVLLFLFAGLLHTILGNVFIVIPILTIVFAVLSLVKSDRDGLSSVGILGIMIGAIYVGMFIYQHL